MPTETTASITEYAKQHYGHMAQEAREEAEEAQRNFPSQDRQRPGASPRRLRTFVPHSRQRRTAKPQPRAVMPTVSMVQRLAASDHQPKRRRHDLGPILSIDIPNLHLHPGVVPVDWEPPLFVVGQLRASAYVTHENSVLVGHLRGPVGYVFDYLDQTGPRRQGHCQFSRRDLRLPGQPNASVAGGRHVAD